jgi:phosphatidylglycerol:prolipoprotein diacylglycerol transferase
VDPVAFRLGPLAVHWYGLAYLVGFVAAGLILRQTAQRWSLGMSTDDVLNILLATITGVLVGSRLGYVLLYGGPAYWRQPSRIFAVWDGGMSFHGGLAGILIAGVVLSRTMRMPMLTLCDLGAIGAPMGFGLGRLANFVNAELWGRVTEVPWGIVFPGAGPLPRHPSQLYEAMLEGVVLFTTIFLLSRKLPPRPRGELVGWFLGLYGAFRIAVEFFREPDVQLGFIAGGWLTMGMLLSVPMVVAGVTLVAWARRRGLPQVGPERPEAEATR